MSKISPHFLAPWSSHATRQSFPGILFWRSMRCDGWQPGGVGDFRCMFFFSVRSKMVREPRMMYVFCDRDTVFCLFFSKEDVKTYQETKQWKKPRTWFFIVQSQLGTTQPHSENPTNPSAPDYQHMFHHFGCCLLQLKKWHVVFTANMLLLGL